MKSFLTDVQMVISNIEICSEQKYSLLNSKANITNKNVYIICIWTGNFFMVQITASFYFASNYSIGTATNQKMPIKFELFARSPQSTQSFAYFLWKDDQTFSYEISLCLMNSFCAMNSTRNRYLLNFFTMLVTCN